MSIIKLHVFKNKIMRKYDLLPAYTYLVLEIVYKEHVFKNNKGTT